MKSKMTRLVAVVMAGGCWLTMLLGAGSARAESVPYKDDAAAGVIGLCNAAGQSITSGNIHDKPFVWRAVASKPPAEPYGSGGTRATLLAYQPRPNAAADQWSGDTLTATSTYTNPRYPMAQATSLDFTLEDFLKEYKPLVNGMIQLRMFVGALGVGTLTDSYPATDIKITGDTWHVVRGGDVPCTQGSATSPEVVPASRPSGSVSGTATGTAPVSTAPSGAVSSSTTADPSASEAKNSSSAELASSTRGGGSSSWPIVIAAVAAGLVVCVGGAILWRRHRTS
jgi:hypothetical protein